MSANLYPAKVVAGLVAGSVSIFFDSLLPLFVSVMVFECVDFVTGCIKSAVVSKRKGERFAFESIKAWRTIYKILFIFVGICLAEMLDQLVSADGRLRFANYFTAFCCGVEFWSFLENSAVISEHPVFLWLRKFMKFKLEDQIGMEIPDKHKKR